MDQLFYIPIFIKLSNISKINILNEIPIHIMTTIIFIINYNFLSNYNNILS